MLEEGPEPVSGLASLLVPLSCLKSAMRAAERLSRSAKRCSIVGGVGGRFLGGQGPAQLVDRRDNLSRVFGIQLDGFLLEMEGAILNRRLDRAIDIRRYTDEFLQLEKAGAELLPTADDAVCLGISSYGGI